MCGNPHTRIDRLQNRGRERSRNVVKRKRYRLRSDRRPIDKTNCFDGILSRRKMEDTPQMYEQWSRQASSDFEEICIWTLNGSPIFFGDNVKYVSGMKCLRMIVDEISNKYFDGVEGMDNSLQRKYNVEIFLWEKKEELESGNTERSCQSQRWRKKSK